MMLTGEQKRRLIQAATMEGVDPDELISEAESMEQGEGAGAGAEQPKEPDRILIGFLPWVKVRELRARLGLDRVDGDDEFCVAFGIKRGFLAPISGNKNEDDQ